MQHWVFFVPFEKNQSKLSKQCGRGNKGNWGGFHNLLEHVASETLPAI